MPGYDRTGPFGAGPMTGRGFGPCGLGLGWRRRFGAGRGMGRYFGNWNYPQNPKEELEDVEKEEEELKKGK